MSVDILVAVIGSLAVLGGALVADRRAAKKGALDSLQCLVDNLQEELHRQRAERDRDNAEKKIEIDALKRTIDDLKIKIEKMGRELEEAHRENLMLGKHIDELIFIMKNSRLTIPSWARVESDER